MSYTVCPHMNYYSFLGQEWAQQPRELIQNVRDRGSREAVRGCVEETDVPDYGMGEEGTRKCGLWVLSAWSLSTLCPRRRLRMGCLSRRVLWECSDIRLDSGFPCWLKARTNSRASAHSLFQALTTGSGSHDPGWGLLILLHSGVVSHLNTASHWWWRSCSVCRHRFRDWVHIKEGPQED